VLGVKIPVSRSKEDLLTSGGVDFAAALLFTYELGPFVVHVNVGAILPGDIQVFEEDVEARSALTFGFSAACRVAEWAVLVLQVQGHQSMFRSGGDTIRNMDDLVLSIHGGARIRVGSYFVDGSIGTGVGDEASDLVFTLAACGKEPPAQGPSAPAASPSTEPSEPVRHEILHPLRLQDLEGRIPEGTTVYLHSPDLDPQGRLGDRPHPLRQFHYPEGVYQLRFERVGYKPVDVVVRLSRSRRTSSSSRRRNWWRTTRRPSGRSNARGRTSTRMRPTRRASTWRRCRSSTGHTAIWRA
jgi:hypothetical protein